MTKKIFKLITVDNFEKEEVFLEEMAQKGWYFSKYTSGIYHFEQGTPEKYTYCIDYKEEKDDETSYLQLFEDAGWENVYAYPILRGKWMYFRKEETDETQKEQIFTDRQSFITLWKKIRHRWTVFGLAMIFLLLCISTFLIFRAQQISGIIILLMTVLIVLLYGKMYINLTRKIRFTQLKE